jgi:thiol-disulfide isomerase/thioredoxin
MKLNRKKISNIVFLIFIILILNPGTRSWFATPQAWIMRQLAFSPSIENVSDRINVPNYNWNLKGINSEDINFTALKGKVIFVNFWATWCAPCRAEMPMIQSLYTDYKDKIAFILVTSDNEKKVETFLKNNKYNLPMYNMLSREPKQFATRSIPASYLLDKNGNIIISKIGAANWNSDKVRKTLDELIKQ